MKFGCCISIKHIQLAKAFGYDFVELAAKELMEIAEADWSSVKEQILEVGIPILGFNSFCDERTPLVGPHVQQSQTTAYLDTVLQRAHDLHCQNIGIGAPKARLLPDDYPYETAAAQMELFLQTAAEKASSYRLNILYEALHPKECNFGNASSEIYQTVKALQQPNISVVWDVYHSINASETYDQLTGLFDLVKHVHLCSWNQNLDRFYLFPKDQHYVDDCLAFLSSHGYDHTISIEASDANFEQAGKTSLVMLAQALQKTVT